MITQVKPLEYGEPCAGYTVSGRHEDGTWHVWRRRDGQTIGTADDYESAREIALNDCALGEEVREGGVNA